MWNEGEKNLSGIRNADSLERLINVPRNRVASILAAEARKTCLLRILLKNCNSWWTSSIAAGDWPRRWNKGLFSNAIRTGVEVPDVGLAARIPKRQRSRRDRAVLHEGADTNGSRPRS